MLVKTALMATLPALFTALPYLTSDCQDGEGNLGDYSMELLDGSRNVSLSEYSGKVVMLVNVATYWGFASQYPDFNALKALYNGDLEILAVPSNQFYNQEVSDPVELMNAIRWVRPGNDFAIDFPMFKLSAVNGADRIPVYQFVTSRCPVAPVPNLGTTQLLLYAPLSAADIRWNFEKILFDTNGVPFRRYAPTVEPLEMVDDILSLISRRV